MAYNNQFLTRKGEKRYQVQVRLKDLRPIVRTFSKKKDALAFSKKVEGDTELSRKLGAPVKNIISLKELVDLYMDQYT